MAILPDANLGATDSATATSISLTTTAAAAAAARVVVFVSYFTNSAATISGVTVAGTACARDKRATNGSDILEIWSCHRAATTPSASTVTASFSNSPGGGILLSAASFTGILQTGYLDGTSNANTTAASWNSGSASNVTTEALFIGGCGTEDPTNPTTSTAVNGTELHDRYRVADQQGIVTGYRIETTVASRNVSGTLSNSASTANTGALAIYGSAGAPAADVMPDVVMAPRIPAY